MTSFAGYWLRCGQIYASDGIVGQVSRPLNDRLSPRIQVQCIVYAARVQTLAGPDGRRVAI